MRILLTPIILISYAYCTAQSHDLLVDISGFKENGIAYVLLFQEGQEFDANSEECTRTKVEIENGKALLNLTGLASGKYAVMVYHDQNKNGKLDTNVIGMPKEGVGNSMNYKGIPSFRKCQFNIPPHRELNISIVYL